MGSGTRQFKALMRKNYIQWKRQLGCAFCEICCPAVVMFLMVILRNVVDPETFPVSSLIIARQPSMPAFSWDGEKWTEEEWGEINSNLTPFFKYGDYPLTTNYEEESYQIGTDRSGPLYFLPQQCLEKFSFQLPSVPMPIIAVVGERPLIQPAAMMQSYLNKLHEVQKAHPKEVQTQLNLLYAGGDHDDKVYYPDFRFEYFDNKDKLFDYTSADDYTFQDGSDGICFGFEMTYDDKTSKYGLELYFNDQQSMGGPNSIGIPNTQKPAYDPLATVPDLSGFQDYLSRGYTTLHNLAANIVLKLETGEKNAKISLLTAPMPATNNTKDSYSDILTLTLPFLLLLIFIPPVYNMVFQIVREKESRIKESMRMMGMKDRSYWLSWYVYYTCISTVIVFLAWLVMLINTFPNSNGFLVFLFFLFYAQAVFGEIVFLSSLFENSKYSGLVGTLIYFGLQLMGIPVQSTDSSGAAKAMLSIIPQVAMQQTCAVFGNLEGSGLGLNFSNMTEEINNYTFLTGLVMLIVSMGVFILLGFWMDAVLPRTYGERLPVFFCCTKKFCTSCCRRGDDNQREVNDEQFGAEELQRRNTLRDSNGRQTLVDPFELKYLDKENYEPVPPEIARMELENQFLQVQDLTKVYPNGFQAVNGINLKMYNGQIFALLGHNGAGKSTTISMLTGLLSRSTGEAKIFNDDLFEGMNDVRQYMGVCPQHDVLFELLTPEEHLDIFYDFKGGDPARKQEECTGLIVDVGVAPDKHKVAGSLSGGNKRKLSVAIALCGNSRLVMLDEPTAGMDLSARRSLWDMLKNYRNNRIIVLTTHYMDEADVLGDRIGIMGKGKILCLGTSLFLKNRYGAGYKLTMVKKHKQPNKLVQPYLEGVFGQVEKLSEVSQEITFKINYEQAAQFENFFAQFDERMDQLDILSYGISMTTLEEVFIKANEHLEGRPDDQNADQDALLDAGAGRETRNSSINRREEAAAHQANGNFSPSGSDHEDLMQSENLVGKGTLGESVRALLIKRFNIYKRDKCGLVCEVLVPVILVLFGLSLLQIAWLKDSPAFVLDTSAYPGPQRLLFNNENRATDVTNDQYTPQELSGGLPSSGSYFETTFDKVTTDYSQFYYAVNEQQHVGDTQPYRFGSYEIFKAEKTAWDFQVNVFVNATSQQTVPYFHQYMYDSIFTNVNKDLDKTIQLEVTTAPFPIFYVFESRVASGQAIDFAVLVSIALALIPCVIISFIIKEREQQLKHMQVISGVSLPAYWISNTISDIVKTYVPIFIIIIFTFIFNLKYDGVWVLLIVYPIAIVPFTYVTSFLFKGDTVAQIMTLFMHFLIGGILPIVIFVLWNIPSTANLGDSMRWWFVMIPTYCVGEGIIFASAVELLEISRKGIQTLKPELDLKSIDPDVYAFENLTGNYVFMILTGIFCAALLVIIEADIFQKCANFSFESLPSPRDDLDMDDDVIAEEERLSKQHLSRKVEQRDENNAPLLDPENLEKSQSELDVIRVYNFRKAYTTWLGKPFLAVERISFGLDYGECFALLGVNGAGKSTTFKSLTRDITPTSGEISISGHNVLTEFAQARKLIGYCPQHDAIFPLMTVEEHLWFYSRIKGIPENRREAVVEDAIEQLNLADHRNKPAGTLSGGNKRKLSVGMAIVGNPPIILLDEPSAGMDPEARRFMWSVVEKISQRDKKSAVILTTHSMEEAEALSTKMGIMVRGGIFRCFGSSQHIKNKFATGFEVQIKIRKPALSELEAFKTTLGLEGDFMSRIELDQARQVLENAPIEGLIIDQLCKNGVGSDLFVEASLNSGRVRMSALINFCFVHQNGFKVIEQLCKRFEQVELLEQCGDYYKMRVPREDKTIGYLFGQIETMKKDLNIQEYGVQQTSLEQIFQNFAQQSVDDNAAFTFKVNALDQLMLLNPDRKSTMKQKRMSQKGRKSEQLIKEEGPGRDDDDDYTPMPAGEGTDSRLLK